jgi:cytochrome oxidase assembly protein ShyY1
VYRFALRPWWLVSHVFVLLLVVTMINLGFWQLRRLDEKQAINEQVRERASGEPVLLAELVDPSDPVSTGASIEWENVVVSGEYLADEEVLIRSRSLDGRPGFWVLMPLETSDGAIVAVNRGWVPFDEETDGSDAVYETPTGEVTVTGLVQRSVAPARSSGDDQTTVAHADLEWLDEEVSGEVYPVYVQLEGQSPDPAASPVVLGPPDLSDGPHLGYAVQWFVFSAIAIVGYPVILRRVAHQKAAERRAPADESSEELVGA